MARITLGPAGVAGPTGPAGPAGPPGPPGVNYQGLWLSGRTYTINQWVAGSDGLYYWSRINGNIGHDPVTDDGTNWAPQLAKSAVIAKPNTGKRLPLRPIAGVLETYNVRDFGAVGDGTWDGTTAGQTDDSISAQATIRAAEAAGGGVIYYPMTPAGGIYLLNGPGGIPVSGGGVSWALSAIADRVKIRADPGVTFKSTLNTAIFFAFGYSKPAGPLSWANYRMSDVTMTPIKNLTGPIAQGASKVTLASIGDASYFAVGDWVYLRTGDAEGFGTAPDAEFGMLVGISGADLMLAWPLSKPMAQEYWVNADHSPGPLGSTTTTDAGHGSAPFGIAKVTDRLLHNFEIIGGKFLLTGDGVSANPGGAPILPPMGLNSNGAYGTRLELEPGSEISGHLVSFNEQRDYVIDASMRFTSQAAGEQNFHNVGNADTGCTDGKIRINAASENGVCCVEMHEGCSGIEVDAKLRNPKGDTSDIPSLSAGGRQYGCDVDLEITNGPTNSATVIIDKPDVGHGNTLRYKLLGDHPAGGVDIAATGWQILEGDAGGATVVVNGSLLAPPDAEPVVIGLETGWGLVAGERTPRYAIDSSRKVHVEGVAQNTSGVGNSGPILILPPGYRPSEPEIRPDFLGSVGWLVVNGAGQLNPAGTVAAGNSVAFAFDFFPV